MSQTFYTPARLIDHRVRVLMLGAGGTGSEVFDALARLHGALVRLGHPGGLHVTLMDGDTVSESNVGRQRFSRHDVGCSKAAILVHRYNLFYDLDWVAEPYYLNTTRGIADLQMHNIDLLVSCVDRADVRVAIARAGARPPISECSALWADFGNGSHRGQFVLGHWAANPHEESEDEETPAPLRLPHVFDLFPELTQVNDAKEPSCSFEEAINQQDLFVNRTLADAGVSILWNLLRHGSIGVHGAFVDVRSLNTRPLPINAEVWSHFGYTPPRSASTKRKSAKSPVLAA